MRKVKFYYEVVKSAILPLDASFLAIRVYSKTSLDPIWVDEPLNKHRWVTSNQPSSKTNSALYDW